MNPENYGTLEACQALQAAGIVMETEKEWYLWKERGESKKATWHDYCPLLGCQKVISRPSLAEMWRELPGDIYINKKRYRLTLWKIGKSDITGCTYTGQDGKIIIEPVNNINPIDALIHLRIWLKEKGERDE